MTTNRFALGIERSRSRRPVTWLTLVGVLLLPVLIGGVLVAALYNPVERLDNLTAAIVNEDEPVTIDDQTVPLGRQLTAGLVEGSDDLDSNLTWTISNADDAAAGLADGTYAAVITIPENFSAAATSTRPGETPEQATIQVTTPPDSLIVDDAITAQVANTAASAMGTQLSSVYLENVLLGFTTLGDQLGTAADGASKLADGAQTAADGAAQLGDGAGQLSTGATDLQSGLTTLADKTGETSTGAQQLADGANAGAAQLEQNGLVPDQVSQVADGSALAAAGVLQLANACAASGASADYCTKLVTAATTADAAASGTVKALNGFDTAATATLAGQLRQMGSGAGALASGLTQLAGGIDQAAAGAGQLATGATGIQDGAVTLADGIAQLATGNEELATGLATASDSLPSYTDEEATDLATVVADPVAATGVGTSLFGASAIPLLATLALWFGGLATFIALQAVSRGALTSRAPSALLALRAYAPAAGLGALQGLLVAGVVQLAASYAWADWWLFAAVCVGAGVAFAAVNQALVAVFGGAGRWVSAIIGVLAVASGVVSTVPGVLSSIAGLMPTAPAYQGMVSALTATDGLGAAIAGLTVWTLLSLGATVLAVVRRRTTTARALLAAAPAPA